LAKGMTAGLHRYSGQLSFTFFMPIAKIFERYNPKKTTIIMIEKTTSVDFI